MLKVLKVLMEPRVSKVLMELRVRLERRVLMVHKVHKVHKV